MQEIIKVSSFLTLREGAKNLTVLTIEKLITIDSSQKDEKLCRSYSDYLISSTSYTRP